jgi:hypothetical protein
MSGSAGLSPSKGRKPDASTLNAYAPNLRKECAGLVAGRVVLTAEGYAHHEPENVHDAARFRNHQERDFNVTGWHYDLIVVMNPESVFTNSRRYVLLK